MQCQDKESDNKTRLAKVKTNASLNFLFTAVKEQDDPHRRVQL